MSDEKLKFWLKIRSENWQNEKEGWAIYVFLLSTISNAPKVKLPSIDSPECKGLASRLCTLPNKMETLVFLKAGNWSRPERHIFSKNLPHSLKADTKLAYFKKLFNLVASNIKHLPNQCS